MYKYQMSSEMNQAIVDGILQGYKDYLEERREKREKMHISSAYAWTKGNHIDHNVVESSKSLSVKYARATAGYSWGYLQFAHEDTSSMFIMKNGKYFNASNFPNAKNIRGEETDTEQKENYLQRLSYINNGVDFPETQPLLPDDEKQIVSLIDDETLKEIEEPGYKKLLDEFSRFYIVTYEINDSQIISQISLLMPNPNDLTAYLVEDLTDYISLSSVEFLDNDFEAVLEEKKERDAQQDYGISFEIAKTGEGDGS